MDIGYLLDKVLKSMDPLLPDSSVISYTKDHLQLFHELKFLKIYMLCFDECNRHSLLFAELVQKFESSAFQTSAGTSDLMEITFSHGSELSDATFDLLEIIQQLKPEIKEDCLNFSSCSFECEFSIEGLLEFMMDISASLHDLLDLKADMLLELDVKVKIESLKNNLDLFKKDFEFAAKRFRNHEDLIDFKIHIQAWACRAACLSLLFWVLDVKKENLAPRMDVILSKLLKKTSTIRFIHVDFILKVLFLRGNILEDSSFASDMKDQYFIHDLKCLKIYMLCLAKWNDSPFGKNRNFGIVEESHIESALEEAARKYRMSECDFSELLQIIQQCKPKIEEDCLKFLSCPFECEFSIDELPEFMMDISASLHDLLDLKADMILDVKVKIGSLKHNLDFCKEFLEVIAKCCGSHEDLKDFKIHVHACACRAACLSLLYWVLDVKKENMAPRMDVILSDLQKTISPSTPEVIRMYLAVPKASKLSAEDSLMGGELALKFAIFLKSNLQVDPEEDGIQMLFIDFIFLITFLMDRPEAENLAARKLIITQADTVVEEVASLICSLSSGEINEGIAEERNFALHTSLEKADAIKVEVRKLYAHLFIDPSLFNLPKINMLGFIDSLLEKLKELCFNFPKHQIVMLQEELLSLKESNLKDFSIMELQNKHKDIKDLWTRIVNVAYNAERAVSSFIYIRMSLWHDILCLTDVIEEVKFIKGEMKRIQDQHMYYTHALNSETNSNSLLPLQANISTVDKGFVGFKDALEEIRGQLISGSKELHIISIVGMPGLGKTTLAKKVYSDTSIQYHFNKCAWCTVSQTYNSKRMLLDIFSDLAHCDDKHFEMEEEDLAQIVCKNLKGQRYLIVIDDIWNVSAWDALKMSFPEDNNGSRIMFTSRIHNVIPESKSGYTTIPLNPLSEEESWELLRKKLFGQDSCPPNFVDIGREIATNCKGLPLSIVLTAGLLNDKVESLDWWEQIGESLDLLIAKEGCKDVLELSYKHLPEFLKPCFLYFGLFPEDEEIKVKMLKSLWISEGFIQKHGIKRLEVVAEDYLTDLVARSLVTVTKRSSTGGIKACSVHDLLHDFCIAKGEEENVCKVIRGNEDWYMAAAHAHYRAGIPSNECLNSFLEHVPPASINIHSLLSIYSSPWNPRNSESKNIKYLGLPNFKFLCVLHLNLKLDDFPKRITELVLLRYLSLFCRSSKIPGSIKRLENLETLCLDNLGTGRFVLPLCTWKMKKLRHVSVDECIPTGFGKNVPPMMNVQTFSFLVLTCGEESEKFLRMIPKVRELRWELKLLSGMDFNQIVKLDFLSHLESLVIEFHIGLKSCTFYFPSTLKKLSLWYLRLPWSKISPIAKLPNLEVLKLNESFRGKTWNVGDEEFLKLKCLVLRNLNIRELNASDDSFPCLERLVVNDCDNLKEIPPRFGGILTLKMIRVETYCRSSLRSSVREIQKEQVELGNEDLEVIIPSAKDESSSDSFSDSYSDYSDSDSDS